MTEGSRGVSILVLKVCPTRYPHLSLIGGGDHELLLFSEQSVDFLEQLEEYLGQNHAQKERNGKLQ